MESKYIIFYIVFISLILGCYFYTFQANLIRQTNNALFFAKSIEYSIPALEIQSRFKLEEIAHFVGIIGIAAPLYKNAISLKGNVDSSLTIIKDYNALPVAVYRKLLVEHERYYMEVITNLDTLKIRGVQFDSTYIAMLLGYLQFRDSIDQFRTQYKSDFLSKRLSAKLLYNQLLSLSFIKRHLSLGFQYRKDYWGGFSTELGIYKGKSTSIQFGHLNRIDDLDWNLILNEKESQDSFIHNLKS